MSGMAEVLAAHIRGLGEWCEDGFTLTCRCAWREEVDPRSEVNYTEVFASHQAAMLTAAGFGPVQGENRLMQLAALMAYDAVEDNVKREAAAVALEEAADAIEPRVMQFFKVTQDLNDPHRAWLRARAAAVRGEG